MNKNIYEQNAYALFNSSYVLCVTVNGAITEMTNQETVYWILHMVLT